MENSIEALLESLNDYTIQSKQILQEGSNTIDRILQLQASLASVANCRGCSLSYADRELIERVKKINTSFEYKVATYSNIHNNKKFGVHAEVNVDYVLDAIKAHMDHPIKSFDKTEVNEIAICRTFKYLTGHSYGRTSMSIDDFKEEFKSFAFGTYKKVSLVPKQMTLIKLFERSCFNINYINTNLISDHINSLNAYYHKVEEKFNRISKEHPNMTVSLNGYLQCLDTAIRNTLIMYKAIRQTYYDLNTEYRNIFHQLIHIDNEANSKSLDECSVNYFNSLLKDAHVLNEAIQEEVSLSESTIINSDNPSKLSDKSKSLLDELKTDIQNELIRRENEKEKISLLVEKESIISKVANNDLNDIDSVNRVYTNIINRIDMSNFISVLDNKIDFCKNQFKVYNETNSDKYTILKDLLSDTNFWEDIPDYSDNKLGFLCDSIKRKLFGSPIIIKIRNLNSTYENIVTIPDYLSKINAHLIDFYKMLLDVIYENTNTFNTKIELINIIKAYIGYAVVISCIYYNLYNFENHSIKLVQNLIDEINLK